MTEYAEGRVAAVEILVALVLLHLPEEQRTRILTALDSTMDTPTDRKWAEDKIHGFKEYVEALKEFSAKRG